MQTSLSLTRNGRSWNPARVKQQSETGATRIPNLYVSWLLPGCKHLYTVSFLDSFLLEMALNKRGICDKEAPCLEYAPNYRRIIVCWHRRIGRRMAVCASQHCICAGSICLCAWILNLCRLKHVAQIQNVCSQTESASDLKPEKNPHMIPNRAQMKKRQAQGFPARGNGFGYSAAIHHMMYCRTPGPPV